jgi:nucleotide-binding universal stress UspA family protein
LTRIWTTKSPRVVVGVDDSPTARWALAWAAAQARLHGLPLLVVHAIRPTNAGYPVTDIPLPSDVITLQRECAIALRALLSDMAISPEVDVTITCPYGHPGQALARLAQEGDLLVIGHSSRSMLSRMITRSVWSYCARHARATLVTIPTPSRPALDARALEMVG